MNNKCQLIITRYSLEFFRCITIKCKFSSSSVCPIGGNMCTVPLRRSQNKACTSRPHGSGFVSLASRWNDDRNEARCVSKIQLAPTEAVCNVPHKLSAFWSVSFRYRPESDKWQRASLLASRERTRSHAALLGAEENQPLLLLHQIHPKHLLHAVLGKVPPSVLKLASH